MDIADIDEFGNGRLYFKKSMVLSCKKVEGQDNVFHLQVNLVLDRDSQREAAPGQFYMIRKTFSSVQLDRPISVYRSSLVHDRETGLKSLNIEFLILEKGRGTQELCHLMAGDEVEIIGPLGNGFSLSTDLEKALKKKDDGFAKVALVGGGIGVAPVSNFACSLADGTYDFYASFKSGSYGLENLHAKNLFVTTDDGSVGIKGMLPQAFNMESIKKNKYQAVYACGPNAMLSYVKELCKEAGLKCYISMENRMLCGLGACLGCTIETSSGKKRVCKDGPVFDADILEFEKVAARRKALSSPDEVDLGVDIAGIHFKNPVIAASGTFGFGQNYLSLFDVNKLGGICGKGLTLNPKEGNDGVRVCETPSGNINSIGLQNPGVAAFIKDELPQMMKLKCVSIANLAGSDLESYVEGARLLDASDVPMIELNISCPNVKAGGMAWGIKAESAFECVSAVRKVTTKPLMVKLSPNATSLCDVALACIKAGADALSLINTIQAVAIDIEKGRPLFENVRAGLCGPAIKPIALRHVYDLVEAINKLPENERVPVVGMGGISCWQDAVEFIMAGASAIQVGSATFSNPNAMLEIIDGIKFFMASHGYSSIEEMRGIAQ